MVTEPTPVRSPTYRYPEKAKEIISNMLEEMEEYRNCLYEFLSLSLSLSHSHSLSLSSFLSFSLSLSLFMLYCLFGLHCPIRLFPLITTC